MQKNKHPKLNDVVFVDSATKTEFVTRSTLTSEETKSVDGRECYVINVQISSASHPHYTGKLDQIVDTDDIIKRFSAKVAGADQTKVLRKRQKVKERRSTVNELNASKSPTLKDMLKQLQQK